MGLDCAIEYQRCDMSWRPKREKLDPNQASATDFAVLQDGNFYVSGEAGARKSVVLAGSGATGSDMVATVDYHSSGGYENLRGAKPVGGVETMAMPQRDDPPSRCALRMTSTIEAIKRLDACGRLRALLQRPATQARLRLGRWRLKSAEVWYNFTMSGKE